ncbi:MAG: DUF6261 family protein [Bacteroidales bacterium]|jgi:hypothetical protein|nr:DUF6261 family protein [Bacteroidales bacterium]
MANIVRFKFPGLWNSEYPLVVERIIDILEAHEPHNLHFGQSFERLAAFRPLLAKIETQENFDQDSALLSELDQQRDTFFNIIHAVSKAFQRTPISEISNHAHRIMTMIKKHGKDIASANYTAETKRLYDLVADVKAQPDIMESLEALSLTPLFVRMDEVNKEFDRLFMQRSQRQAETEKINIHATRLECDKAITTLWYVIESCCCEYGEQNYLPLISAINNLNTYYKQQLAARSARRKANQNVSNEKSIEPMNDEVSD